MSTRPSFQFYPGDWLRCLELRRCSPLARALWADLLCLMHFGEPYGHLATGGVPLSEKEIARSTGFTVAEIRRAIAELDRNEVCARTEDEHRTIYSRRMVRDEETRMKRALGGPEGAEHGVKGAEHGHKGGRPRKSKGGSETPVPVGEQPAISRNPTPVPTGVLDPPSKPAPSSSSPSAEEPPVVPRGGTTHTVATTAEADPELAFLAWWCEEWRRRKGVSYAVDERRDREEVRLLLAGALGNVDEVRRAATALLADAYWNSEGRGYDLRKLRKEYNAWSSASATKPAPAPAAPHPAPRPQWEVEGFPSREAWADHYACESERGREHIQAFLSRGASNGTPPLIGHEHNEPRRARTGT